jgi:hypothetical protein
MENGENQQPNLTVGSDFINRLPTELKGELAFSADKESRERLGHVNRQFNAIVNDPVMAQRIKERDALTAQTIWQAADKLVEAAVARTALERTALEIFNGLMEQAQSLEDQHSRADTINRLRALVPEWLQQDFNEFAKSLIDDPIRLPLIALNNYFRTYGPLYERNSNFQALSPVAQKILDQLERKTNARMCPSLKVPIAQKMERLRRNSPAQAALASLQSEGTSGHAQSQGFGRSL